MQKIPLNLARPGMVLAKPVARADGIAVAAAGSAISASLLGRLDAMGVTHLVVEGEPVRLDGPAGVTAFDKRLERLTFLFRKYPDDKWMGQIRRLLDNYFRLKAASSAARVAAAGQDRETSENDPFATLPGRKEG